LLADDAPASAAMIRAILAGEEGAPTRVVLANAAAALVAAGRVITPMEGVARAAAALASGRAAAVLEELIRATRE
jgi:anthranilate phosphoribosyltransferase